MDVVLTCRIPSTLVSPPDFLKEHFKSVQTSSPGASQADVMRLLGEKWRVEKQRREAESERGIEGLTGGLKGMAIEVD